MFVFFMKFVRACRADSSVKEKLMFFINFFITLADVQETNIEVVSIFLIRKAFQHI